MRSKKSAVYLATPIASVVVEFLNDGNTPPVVTVENLSDRIASPGTSVPLKFRESSDGVNWADIPGSNATVNPGDTYVQAVVASQSRIALHAGGNAWISVSVLRQVNGSPSNLGAAL